MNDLKSNLLKFSFIWNFHNKKVCSIQSNIFWHFKIRLCNKDSRNSNFSASNKQFGYYWILLFIINHISNHVIKNCHQKSCHQNQYFTVLSWIVIFNIFVDILHII